MAKQLLNSVEKCRVDIFDRNPHPYGLIRTGVAPDHQAMKKIMNDFREVFDQNADRCKFFGNVWVGDIDKSSADYDIAARFEKGTTDEAPGKNISIDALRANYSGVVLAYGASKDRLLGLDHELTANNIYPSRRIVNWYNGSLDNDIADLGLEGMRDVSVIGNGNIFCDIARVLLKDPKDLAVSDMPASVVEQMRNSQVVNVQSIGRRGITHAAFTTKEIRELAAIPNLELYMMRSEVQNSMTEASEAEMNSNYARAVGRRTEFLLKSFRAIQDEDHYEEIINNGKKKLILRFLLSPISFQIDGKNNVQSVLCSQNKLEGAMNE